MTIMTDTFASLISDRVTVDRMNTSFGSTCPDELGVGWLKYHFFFTGQMLATYVLLWRRLQKRDYDTYYFTPSPSFIGHWRDRIALEIARPYVRQVVGHVHNSNFPEVFEKTSTAQSARRMAEVVDAFVFTNRMLSEQAATYIPASKRRVVHNTVDEQMRCSDEEVSEKIRNHLHGNSLQVLYLSNMVETKGYGDVAEAVEQFNRSSGLDACVDFIGEWPSEQARTRFERRLAQYDSADAMHVHGRITDRERVQQAMIDADVFVLPTYYPNEAQPVSIIEAFNAGTPAIATRHASIPEYVRDDENGYLVEKQAPSQIACALEALTDRSNWADKARAARRTYRELFSPEAVKEQMLSVLNSAPTSSGND
ncbi:glycosyltransferase family 4 protein [Salinibacter ruber]|nr:glycosyltransferase [Salinibacter ruber]MCS3650590.1 glycosyltransferase involved in cell wall biosynthesis [Salinibacter ruber]